LAGGAYLDIRISAGLSIPSFYRCVHKCIDAILLCDDLAYSFPTQHEDIEMAAKEFKRLALTMPSQVVLLVLMDFCFSNTYSRATNETGNVKAYFSGHYQAYHGINVQVACDHKCRFLHVCVAAPGGVNDISAFRKTLLHGIMQNLPIGKHIIGDNAYVCAEHIYSLHFLEIKE
jgi:hypothetical protein